MLMDGHYLKKKKQFSFFFFLTCMHMQYCELVMSSSVPRIEEIVLDKGTTGN